MELVDPALLALCRPRNHALREDTTETGVGERPPEANNLDKRRKVLLESLAVFVGHPSEGAIEDQASHSLRMLDCVADSDLTRLAHGHERIPIKSRSCRHGLEVAHSRLQREILWIPVRQSITAFVITDDGRDSSQRVEKVPEHRIIPVVLEMADPVLAENQRRTNTVRRVSDPHSVRPATETNLLPGDTLSTHRTSRPALQLKRREGYAAASKQEHITALMFSSG